MEKRDTKRFSALIDSFFRMDYSSKVQTRFYAWLLGKKHREEKEKAMLEKFGSYDILPDENVQQSLSEVHKRLGFPKSRPAEKAKRIPIRRHLLRVAAVAIPAIILAGAGFYFSESSPGDQPGYEYTSVVAQVNEKKSITLPDNSKVWVNSGSTVKYPKDNAQDKRLVRLSGEAYFVVEKDTEKPFVVKTDHLSVTVTGTEFDVKEVKGADKTEVTLTQGKVNVETDKKESFSLVPGQRLIYYHLTGRTEVTELDAPAVDNAVIWKSEYLQFEDLTLKDMLSGIEVYFNVATDRSALKAVDNKLYTIRFSPGEDLNTTMRLLKELTGGFSYRIEGQTIYITDDKTKK